jgi:lipopolysaccharide export system permease protein
MGILAKQVIKEVLKVLIPCWLAFGFLLFLLEWLAQVFSLKTDGLTALLLYLYKFPSYLYLVFPVAVLFTMLIVLGGMNRNREIMAAQSLGYSRWAIAQPAALGVLIASVLHGGVTHFLSPWGMKNHWELYDTEVLKRPPRFSKIRQERIWYRNQDVLYNVRYFEPGKNELYDVTIYTFDEDFHIAQTIEARKAEWNGKEWILSDGFVSLLDKRIETPVSESFKTRVTQLIDQPDNLSRVEITAEIANQIELGTLIQRYKSLGINTAKLEVVFHSRWSFGLVPFVFLLLVLPRALRFRRVQTNVAMDAILVTSICMAYWLIFNAGVNLGNTGKVPPWVSSWVPSFILAGLILIYNKTRSLKSESE